MVDPGDDMEWEDKKYKEVEHFDTTQYFVTSKRIMFYSSSVI